MSCYRKLSLLAAAVAAVFLTSAAQTESPPQSRFEVATVKLSPPDARLTSFSAPGEVTYTATTASLMGLLMTAFGVTEMQIAGLPKWSESARYDVVAKPEGEKPLDPEHLRQALQQLLQERLHLSAHHVTKEVRGYKLIVAKGGPRLQPSKGGREGRVERGSNDLAAPNITLQELGPALRFFVEGAPVVDETGIKGNFDIKLNFATEEDAGSALPSVFTALQEQLGLKLVAAKVPLDTVVVDRVDRIPTAN
jgi:uncharacterized protein (TIGR03435 family)